MGETADVLAAAAPPSVGTSAAGHLLGVSVSEAVRFLNERHDVWRLDRHAVGEALRDGRVSGGSLDQLESQLVGRICLESPCRRVALGESGYCVEHVRGALSRGKPRSAEERDNISAAMRDHQVSAATRAKIAAAHSKQPGERRYCRQCGNQIRPKRRDGLDDNLDQEVLSELGLDLVPASVIRAGGGQFCSNSCHLLWEWTHEREKFPQDGPGPTGFKCDLCRRSIERWPSQVKNRDAGRYRFICTECIAIYRRERRKAVGIVNKANPRAPLSKASVAAFDRLWASGKTFEKVIRAHWPHDRGRRPPLCVDLVILALHRRGFTDAAVCELLNHGLRDGKKIPGMKKGRVTVKYVEQRRHRANIHRVPAVVAD